MTKTPHKAAGTKRRQGTPLLALIGLPHGIKFWIQLWKCCNMNKPECRLHCGSPGKTLHQLSVNWGIITQKSTAKLVTRAKKSEQGWDRGNRSCGLLLG